MESYNSFAPIVLFVYNRPRHTERTLKALKANEYSEKSSLFIFSDGPSESATEDEKNKIREVREVIRKEKWCKEIYITERFENLGLAESINQGVTEIIKKFGKVIVLEDDIKVDPRFLMYMNQALNFFYMKKEVFHINGFNNESRLQFLLKDYYFTRFMSCWGWATWLDRWDQCQNDYLAIYHKLVENPRLLNEFNYENTINFHQQLKGNIDEILKTWAILWYSTVFLENGLCLTPKYSLVENIGLDGSGVNSGKSNLYSKLYKNKSFGDRFNFSKIKNYKETLTSRLHLKLYFKYGPQIKPYFLFKECLKLFR